MCMLNEKNKLDPTEYYDIIVYWKWHQSHLNLISDIAKDKYTFRKSNRIEFQMTILYNLNILSWLDKSNKIVPYIIYKAFLKYYFERKH